MAGIAAATLTGAGFSAGTAGTGLSGGTPYTKSQGSFSIVATLFTEVEGSGFAGMVQVFPNGDTTQSDATAVAALLQSIGLTPFATWPNTNVSFEGQGVAPAGGGGIPCYSISF